MAIEARTDPPRNSRLAARAQQEEEDGGGAGYGRRIRPRTAASVGGGSVRVRRPGRGWGRERKREVIELGQGLGRADTVESLLHRGRQLLRHQFFFFLRGPAP
jgi:hypothetical protein